MANLKDKYDVVVIGAGIGGLTSGALLAKEGLDVLVAEQGSKPGGYCVSSQRDGFTFDTAVDAVMGCEKGGPIYDTLEELALTNDIDFIKLAAGTRIIGTGYDISVTSIEALANELKKLFPAESTSIDAFLGDCKALAREMERLMEPAPDLLGLTGKLGLIVRFLFGSPKMRKYGGKSAGEVLNTFFKEPRLRAIFGTILPFGPAAMAPLIMNILGGELVGYYPRGGAGALANVFTKGLTKHGGELALKTRVARILIKNGQAIGVELVDGSRIKSRYVVSNADGRQTFLNLVGEQHLSSKFVRELRETSLSRSSFLVSLGVDLDLKAMGFDGTSIVYNRSDDLNEIFSTDLTKCYMTIRMHSLRDSSQAPEGMATVQLHTMLPYDYMGNWGREKDGTLGRESTEMEEAVAGKLIALAEGIIPGLSEHIVVKDIISPLAFERYTLNSEGATMGWFPAPGGKMRSQKTPVKNLYQAGAWTFPGPSIYMVVPSGRNAAQIVLNEARS